MVGTRRLEQLSSGVTLPDGDLVVALSGGADSAFLAWLGSRSGQAVRAVHIDHGFEGSPTMREAAVEVASQLNLDLQVVKVEVGEGPSPEGQAREARYQALTSAVLPEERVLTAHTSDDNAETVLINLIRGTGVKGLAGIPPFREPNIFRPLLGVSRSTTREGALLAGLSFVDDPMNFDLALTRNRLRHSVMPLLLGFNPSLVESVGRLSEAARSDGVIIESNPVGVAVRSTDAGIAVAVGELRAVGRDRSDRVLLAAMVDLGVEASAAALRRVNDVVDGASGSAQVADGLVARRRGPMLVLEREPAPPTESELGRVRLLLGRRRRGRLTFEVQAINEVCRVAPLDRWHAIFPTDADLWVDQGGSVYVGEQLAWIPGSKRYPVAWYETGNVGYLSVFAREEVGWTSNP